MLIQTDAPSPQKYAIPSSDFGDREKGFVFGISREMFDKVNLFKSQLIILRYTSKSIRDKTPQFQGLGLMTSRSCSTAQVLLEMGSVWDLELIFNQVRIIFMILMLHTVFNDSTIENPGPGAYDQVKAISISNNKPILSTYKSPGCLRFGYGHGSIAQ